MALYIGLISGTSMDGIDAALVDIDGDQIRTVEFATFAYSRSVKKRLFAAIDPAFRASLHDIATLNILVGREFASAAIELIKKAGESPQQIIAIGSHGQTIRHSPKSEPPYSWQIGDGASIATRTGITTVCDFRSQDIAAGGEGAPLVPAFHEWCFRDRKKNRAVVNIGGISNVTILPADSEKPILGYDTGPGNCLMDAWILNERDMPFDQNGQWAESGRVCAPLLDALLADPYIAQAPPKSTGREHYNLNFVNQIIDALACERPSSVDVQTTLLEFTISTINQGINITPAKPEMIIVCGGGARNTALMQRLTQTNPGRRVHSADDMGMSTDALEATAFAWFAYNRINRIPLRLTTHSTNSEALIGALYEVAKSV